MVQKLLLRHPLEKCIYSWHLQEAANNIRELLLTFDWIILVHTKREGNKVVDCLAKWGSGGRDVAMDEGCKEWLYHNSILELK